MAGDKKDHLNMLQGSLKRDLTTAVKAPPSVD